MNLHLRVLTILFRRIVESRPADVVIGGMERPYLKRWYVIPRNRWLNIYLHRFLRSDDDRALHSHPWMFNASWLLHGEYLEVLPADARHPEGQTVMVPRREGSIRFRWGESWHRIQLFGPADSETPVWTLFITGARVREWGFACPNGFRHWKDFTAFRRTGSGSEVGPGCGDDT